MFDHEDKLVMIRNRPSNNYYLVDDVATYLKTRSNDGNVWHRRLRHINYYDLMKLSRTRAIKGLFHITNSDVATHEACQHGKQWQTSHLVWQTSHLVLQHMCTSHIIDLWHMDIMRSTDVTSLGGKWYIYLHLDGYL